VVQSAGGGPARRSKAEANDGAMTDKPNFVLIPDQTEAASKPTLLSRLRQLVAPSGSHPPDIARAGTEPEAPTRPRLIFAVDATASREPAWETARQVTDALFRVLPGELEVALAVHGGSLLHTFTPFTANAGALRDRAAGIACITGRTQLLPILERALSNPGVRVVTYIGDVFEESPARGRKLADALGARGIRLIVLHDTVDWLARRDAELFQDLARRTGGCVVPFDANAPQRLRELLAAVAVYAVGGEALLEAKRGELPAATLLLGHLKRNE
jgi:hypothetical protein